MRLNGIVLLLPTIVLSSAAFAQAAAGKPAEDRSEKEKWKKAQIVLYPAAEPQPCLKYQLLPPFLERRPGNAAIHYLKVPHDQHNLFGNWSFWDAVMQWITMPLPELRKARDAARSKKDSSYSPCWLGEDNPGWMMGEIYRGARCESCDWDIPIRDHGFFSILLPEMESERAPAKLLAVRARLQIADGKYDQAIQTFQTSYAFARHVGQAGVCLVQWLVGVTIDGVTSEQVVTFVQQPGSPNLYWALSSLPRPLVDFRLCMEAENDCALSLPSRTP